MRKAGRALIVTLLCGSLAALMAPMALAQTRGSSGLPPGPGNPTANLQQQVDALQNQINVLNSHMEWLSSQIGSGDATKLAVYDRNEQKMGDVVGVQDNIPWVGLAAGNRKFVLQVFPQQLVGQFLWFDGSNCTGNVYISGFTLSKGPNVFALAAVHEPEGMVYAADPNTAPVARLVASVRDSAGACSTFRPFNQNVLPASPVMDLDAVFQRPYSVR